jgi:hypothetical protein
MNDMDIALDSEPRQAADRHALLRIFRTYERWKKRRTLHQLPKGDVRLLVTERLREREQFLNEVKEQLHELETSVDELTDTIRSMRGGNTKNDR